MPAISNIRVVPLSTSIFIHCVVTIQHPLLFIALCCSSSFNAYGVDISLLGVKKKRLELALRILLTFLFFFPCQCFDQTVNNVYLEFGAQYSSTTEQEAMIGLKSRRDLLSPSRTSNDAGGPYLRIVQKYQHQCQSVRQCQPVTLTVLAWGSAYHRCNSRRTSPNSRSACSFAYCSQDGI